MKAKKNGFEISAENAEKIFSKGSEALSDEELSDVTGGAFNYIGIESKTHDVVNASEEEALAILKKVQQALAGE